MKKMQKWKTPWCNNGYLPKLCLTAVPLLQPSRATKTTTMWIAEWKHENCLKNQKMLIQKKAGSCFSPYKKKDVSPIWPLSHVRESVEAKCVESCHIIIGMKRSCGHTWVVKRRPMWLPRWPWWLLSPPTFPAVMSEASTGEVTTRLSKGGWWTLISPSFVMASHLSSVKQTKHCPARVDDCFVDHPSYIGVIIQ